MGVQIIGEVLDHAPGLDLPDGAFIVLFVLAEDARDETRECWPGIQEVCRRANSRSRPTVRRLLSDLEDRKIIRRLTAPSHQPGAAPVVAFRGHRTTYRIEPCQIWGKTTETSHTEELTDELLTETEELTGERLSDEKGAHGRAKGAHGRAERSSPVSGKELTSELPSPQFPSGSRQSRQDGPVDVDALCAAAVREQLRLRTGRDVGDDWALLVAHQLLERAHRTPARPDRWLDTVLQRETDVSVFLPGPTY